MWMNVRVEQTTVAAILDVLTLLGASYANVTMVILASTALVSRDDTQKLFCELESLYEFIADEVHSTDKSEQIYRQLLHS